jgi:hypothetical protein
MKNGKLLVGLPLIILIFTIILTGCDLSPEDIDIIGRFWLTQLAADEDNGTTDTPIIEFTNRTPTYGSIRPKSVTYGGGMFKYKAAGGRITFTTISDEPRGSNPYSINDTALTIKAGNGPIPAKTYYKKQ